MSTASYKTVITNTYLLVARLPLFLEVTVSDLLPENSGEFKGQDEALGN